MIKTENMTVNGRALIRTYSDEHRYVVRDGIAYEEAVDPADKERVYTEGDLINADEVIPDETELSDDEAARILMGEEL